MSAGVCARRLRAEVSGTVARDIAKVRLAHGRGEQLAWENGGLVFRKGITGWQGAASQYRPSGHDCENRASRNSPSFAVALNRGMGSSSLNAEVNAFERLQIVRGWNSSYFGSK